MTRYDAIGTGYSVVRQSDPRIAAQIEQALAEAISVVNVGAGTGSYESRTRRVVAIEPSHTMIAQRARDAAPAIVASAEALPLADASVDAATSFLSVHHWADAERGLREMRRVARQRVIVLTYLSVELAPEARWLTREYFPVIEDFDAKVFPPLPVFTRALGNVTCEVVPIPHDCVDGFLHAYWARPEAYLAPEVRAGMSGFRLMPADLLEQGLLRLRQDLESGAWDQRWGALRRMQTMDVGLRLLVTR